MKILKNLALVLCAMFLLSACGEKSPESVVLKYFEAAKVVDLKTAKECLVKSLAQEFDDMTKSIDADEMEEMKKENANIQVKILSSEIDGENAIVYFEEAHGDHFHKQQVSLKKEDGEWKIDVIY